MQKIIIASLVLLSFLFYSCDNGSLTPGPMVESPLEVLNYDGDNQDAPEFDGGLDLEGAVLFPSDLISAFEGDEIIRIQYYIKDRPSSATLKVYQKSTNNTPDELIYSAAISNELLANSWNEHTLTNPIIIGREDIWVALKFTHVESQRTLGCDPGPAETNGDWINIDGQWGILSQFSEVNINWNIRAVIDPR